MGDKVLVVEDEPTLLETLEYNLARQGYQVYTAADGFTALDIARRERPDAIVLDIMLPGLDGLEVCRILRREMNVPILMLTAWADEVDKVVGLEVFRQVRDGLRQEVLHYLEEKMEDSAAKGGFYVTATGNL
jgi:DNA-binding response OmpR family regulator